MKFEKEMFDTVKNKLNVRIKELEDYRTKGLSQNYISGLVKDSVDNIKDNKAKEEISKDQYIVDGNKNEELLSLVETLKKVIDKQKTEIKKNEKTTVSTLKYNDKIKDQKEMKHKMEEMLNDMIAMKDKVDK